MSSRGWDYYHPYIHPLPAIPVAFISIQSCRTRHHPVTASFPVIRIFDFDVSLLILEDDAPTSARFIRYEPTAEAEGAENSEGGCGMGSVRRWEACEVARHAKPPNLGMSVHSITCFTEQTARCQQLLLARRQASFHWRCTSCYTSLFGIII